MRREIMAILPQRIRKLIAQLPDHIRSQVEEVRIRLGRPLEIVTADFTRFILPDGSLSKYYEAAYCPNADDCQQLLNLISNYSLYALEEELRRGYVTVPGGHRIGLVGEVVVEQGHVKHIRKVASFNIRIAREIVGVAKNIFPLLIDESGTFCHTLIVSPPQCGKTTLLRDLARTLSYGNEWIRPHKVCIVDERSELAGAVDGRPTHDVGPRTDVMVSCPKAEGMMMIIRSMSPDVLVVDEIGRPEDASAVDEAIHAGVTLIATAHGKDLRDLSRRPIFSKLMQQAVFNRFVVLSKRRGTGTVEGVYNSQWERVASPRVHVM